MSTAQDQQSRYPAEFEVWFASARIHHGGYVRMAKDAAFAGWQAARALPAGEPVGWVDDGGQVFWRDAPPADGEDLFTASQVLAMGRVPPGYVAVPVERTEEMKRAVMELLLDGLDIYVNGQDQIVIETDAPRRLWKAFLATAPQPPAAQEVPSGVLDAIRAAGMQLLKGVDGFKLEKAVTASASNASSAAQKAKTENPTLPAAQERKPLDTVAAMKLGMDAYDACRRHSSGTTNWAYAITRFYEAAHGIKEGGSNG